MISGGPRYALLVYRELPDDDRPVLACTRQPHSIWTPLYSPDFIGMISQDVGGHGGKVSGLALVIGQQ